MIDWICEEQKDFFKGRYILDNIITLWEPMEHAEESVQDYILLKIDFDKAYNRLNGQHMLEAL